jgi:1-aminocyclopropane-1-carboxylate deaminase/D-cysteine desulfhydrase-like pyridoxal-dependent ACC family enzyme
MNASSAVGAAVVLFSLAVSPANAMVSNAKTLMGAPVASPMIVKADFVQGHEAVAGVQAVQAARVEASKQMAQQYYDFDVIVTLAALALASGAFVAAGLAGGRRRRTDGLAVVAPREGWREDVMQALEADLALFTGGLRRAA